MHIYKDPVPPKKALKLGGRRPVPPGGHVLAHARGQKSDVKRRLLSDINRTKK